MKAAGTDSSKTPEQPKPQGMSTPYGQATPFAPTYSSFLPDSGPATGITPQMMNPVAPAGLMPAGAPPHAGTGAGSAPADPTIQLKQALAKALAGQAQSPAMGFNVARGNHGVG
jgi:hypothetical protein